MSARKPPVLLRSPLTGRVYIVTSYTERADGMFVARTKYDVTEMFEALAAEAVCPDDRP